MSKEKSDVSKEEIAVTEQKTVKAKPKPAKMKLGDSIPLNEENFSDQLYKQITSVLDGNDPDQFFCMGLPGTTLDPAMYSYDVDSNMIKPAHVKANESKLADRLFDAAFLSSANNGRHLSTQYRTALNMLTPKLNEKLFEAKTKLRDVLMTPYPYNFGDGKEEVLTLEQVFYRLYSEYVEAKEKWAQKKIDKLQAIRDRHKEKTPEAEALINDEYLEWYGTVAESEELIVEEKLGKVLAVFSPGDMEIIAGILESGAGRELEEARMTLDNVGELDPNGGHVYPVTFYPQDWFKKLDTSFTGIDLLDSPAALSQSLQVLTAQKNNITSQINKLIDVIPEVDSEKEMQKAYEDYEQAYHTAFDEYLSNNTKATLDMFKTVVEIISSCESVTKLTDEAVNSVVGRVFGVVSPDDIKAIVDLISQQNTKWVELQRNVIDAARKAVDTANQIIIDKNKEQYKDMLNQLKGQLDDVNAQIDQLNRDIALSSTIQSGDDGDISKVVPKKIPEGFTEIIMTSAFSSIENQESNYSNASESNYGVNFFFGGYSSNSSHQEAYNNAAKNSGDMKIQIGMSVAKVEIDREWFNPGVFLLTADMYNTTSKKISPSDNEASFHDNDINKVRDRMNAMRDCVFPCYPTAFVIAKDVTIKFFSTTSISDEFARSVEDHSSRGGGFFIFSGSSASATSSSESHSSASSTSTSITVRFTAPQILGYYLEAVAPDKSSTISEAANENTDFVSIFEFIAAFKKMLDDHNKKYHPGLFAPANKDNN